MEALLKIESHLIGSLDAWQCYSTFSRAEMCNHFMSCLDERKNTDFRKHDFISFYQLLIFFLLPFECLAWTKWGDIKLFKFSAWKWYLQIFWLANLLDIVWITQTLNLMFQLKKNLCLSYTKYIHAIMWKLCSPNNGNSDLDHS